MPTDTSQIIGKLKEFIEHRYIPSEYPTLSYTTQKWAIEKPLQGLSILDSTPVFANTLAKYIPLLEAGASLRVGVSQVMPHDEAVVSFLTSNGIEVVSNDCPYPFDLVLDCAAAFCQIEARVGYVELTRSGVDTYKSSNKTVFLADTSTIKLIETCLGTGDGYMRAMSQLGYKDWKGRRLVIFGNGKVGRGIASYGRKSGAEVLILDENSHPSEVVSAIESAYAIVTATGIRSAVHPFAWAIVNSHAVVANMGVEDEFGEEVPQSRVLENKMPINFILEEPTHLKYIETTMALHNYGAVELLKGTQKGVITPTKELEMELLNIVRSHGAIENEMEELIQFF